MKNQGLNMLNMLKKSSGIGLLELALVLPVVLLLMFGVFELARGIRANNVIVNMSREGANLVSRSFDTPHNIINALADTADPLEMGEDGMIYITVIRKNTGENPVVVEQHRWTGAGYDVKSRVWGDCVADGYGWTGGSCDLPDPLPDSPPVADLAMTLDDGETVHAVEVFYDYQVVFSYVVSNSPELYSITVF